MSNKTLFTAGPWAVAYNEDGSLKLGGNGDLHTSVISESGFGIVAKVLYTKTTILGNINRLEEETFEANAHLIAAAPEMYEALQNLSNAQFYNLSKEDAAIINVFKDLAKVALTKAQGGQQ